MVVTRRYSYKLGAGDVAVLQYVGFTYLIPMIFGAIFYSDLTSTYRISYPGTLEVVCLALLLISYFALRPVVFAVEFRPIRPLSTWIRASLRRLGRLRKILAYACVLTGVYWVLSGFNLYRYTNDGIASNLSFALIAGIIVSLGLKLYFFRRIFFEEYSNERLTDVLFASSLLLMASGVFGALFAFLMLTYSLNPQVFLNLCFRREASQRGFGILKLSFIAALFLPLAILSFLLGNFIKSGSIDEVSRVFLSSQYIQTFYLYLIERISSSYYSFSFSLTQDFSQIIPSGLTSLGYIFSTFLYRCDVLLGGWFDVARPEVGSMMRLNYLVISEYPYSPREGTSAGLLGAFSYIFWAPFSMVAASVFMLIMARFFNQLNYGGRARQLSALGCALLLYFLLPIFESPFDLLLIFDDGSIYVFVMLMLSMPYLVAERQVT